MLGHRNMTMRELLETTARLVQRAPPRVRLPHALAMAMGFVDYGVERVLLADPYRATSLALLDELERDGWAATLTKWTVGEPPRAIGVFELLLR